MKKIQKKWRVKPPASEKFQKKFPEHSKPIADLLYQRLPANQTAIDEFYNPDYEGDVHDPFIFKDMEKAVERILEAKKKKEKVAVFGDYDVDGVTSSALLYKVLCKMKLKPEVYIPDRKQEGYSLNMGALRYLKKKKIDLIITVDCGIRDFKEISQTQKWGIDVILTDHHLPNTKIPSAFAVINPKNKREKYPFKNLAGVGVAFKLASALIQKAGKKYFEEGYDKWLLDLVALGTVADMVPLIGENRTLVKYGLIVLSKSKGRGIRSLFETARVPLSKSSIPTTQQISFQIAPRINAAGRMDHANISFELLTSNSKKETAEIAQKLEKKNGKRQRVTDKIVGEIEGKIKPSQKIIFEGSKEWPVGILGLAAGKICEKNARPVFIYHQGKTKCRGSIRSIPKFKVIPSLEKCKEFLEDFGGHDLAGGFTFKTSQRKKLEQCVRRVGNRLLKKEDLVPEVEIDTRLKLEDITWKLHEELVQMEPFGMNNPTPLFLVEKASLWQCRVVGNGNKHLKLWFKENDQIFEGIAFYKGERHCHLVSEENPKLDIIFELQSDEWNGQKKLQLLIRDFRVSP